MIKLKASEVSVVERREPDYGSDGGGRIWQGIPKRRPLRWYRADLKAKGCRRKRVPSYAVSSVSFCRRAGLRFCGFAGAVGGLCLLILISIAAYFGRRWWGNSEEKKQGAHWDYPNGYDSQRKMTPHSPTMARYNPSFSTGPTRVSDFAFQPYVSLFFLPRPCKGGRLNGGFFLFQGTASGTVEPDGRCIIDV